MYRPHSAAPLCLVTYAATAFSFGPGTARPGAVARGGAPTPAHQTRPSWSRLGDPFRTGYTTGLTGILIGHDGTLYVSGLGGVAASKDGGQTWTPMNDGLPGSAAVLTLGTAADGRPLAAVGKHAYYFAHGAWRRSQGIEANLRVMSFCLGRGGAVVAVTAWEADVYRSSDNGESFVRVASHVGSDVPYTAGALWVVRSGNGGRLYTGGELASGIYSSDDNGDNWAQSGLAKADGYVGNMVALGFTAGNEPLAGRVSLDGSCLQKYTRDRWVHAADGLPVWDNATAIVCAPDGTLFVTANNRNGPGGVFYSVNAGATWRSAHPLIDTGLHGAMAVDTNYLYECVNTRTECAVYALKLASLADARVAK